MGTNKGITEIQAGYYWDCGSSVGFKYIKISSTSQNVVRALQIFLSQHYQMQGDNLVSVGLDVRG